MIRTYPILILDFSNSRKEIHFARCIAMVEEANPYEIAVQQLADAAEVINILSIKYKT